MQSARHGLRKFCFHFVADRDKLMGKIFSVFPKSVHSQRKDRSSTTPVLRCGSLRLASANFNRLYSTDKCLTNDDVKRKVEEIAGKFQEAMELLDDARDSVGTIYITEDINEAEDSISKVIQDYEALLKQVNQDQRHNVIRTIGLKMEELKSQAQMLKESIKD